MQMLTAGGLPVLTDGVRASDGSNPRGYYEWERIKTLPRDPGCVAEAEGKAVKVISSLLFALPPGHEYQVIFMLRSLEEVMASQAAMIGSLGTQGAQLAPGAMVAALGAHRSHALAWLGQQAKWRVLKLNYEDLLADPSGGARAMADFVGVSLDVEAMARQIDRSLYRQRAPG